MMYKSFSVLRSTANIGSGITQAVPVLQRKSYHSYCESEMRG